MWTSKRSAEAGRAVRGRLGEATLPWKFRCVRLADCRFGAFRSRWNSLTLAAVKRFFLIFSFWNLLIASQAGAITPVILSPPQSMTVNNASAAQFTVVATNAASYQWQF